MPGWGCLPSRDCGNWTLRSPPPSASVHQFLGSGYGVYNASVDGKGLNTFNPMLRDTITLPVWGGGGNWRGGGSIDLWGGGGNGRGGVSVDDPQATRGSTAGAGHAILPKCFADHPTTLTMPPSLPLVLSAWRLGRHSLHRQQPRHLATALSHAVARLHGAAGDRGERRGWRGGGQGWGGKRPRARHLLWGGGAAAMDGQGRGGSRGGGGGGQRAGRGRGGSCGGGGRGSMGGAWAGRQSWEWGGGGQRAGRRRGGRGQQRSKGGVGEISGPPACSGRPPHCAGPNPHIACCPSGVHRGGQLVQLASPAQDHALVPRQVHLQLCALQEQVWMGALLE